ncbi:hypothetical protein Q5P01_002485 [Channa striata]|uniref:AIG1-type G domain-containing protein n=1 Tax=Channa striata TaxID=64152 RepID=A0AA88T4V7_CHASR|nr:hypothetical protein Q5P01_002485 [Channa striata]
MDVSKAIVILGKTGSGKSSLANTIFGEELFTIDHTINSETEKCQAATKSVNGRKITLIDTPGFFDTDRSEEELKPAIVRCITECAPGPHAFLIVLKVEKFTEHEKAVIDKICQYFSEEVLKYATVLFTHGDQLPKGKSIMDVVHQNDFMRDLVQKCGGRCHVIDNKYWNNPRDEYRSNQFQVEELLKTIDKTVLANNGGRYTNEMLQAVEAEIQQEEELIRQSSENMSEEEIRWQARDRAYKKLMIKLAGVTTVSKAIVILGKTGSGKSSLANTIFGEELFTIDHTINSETEKCQAESKSVNGRKITLIDTPGFFDTDRSEEELKPAIVRCITECAPGPHAFLIVLKVEKFTEHEKAVIDKICQYFSEEVLKYATVLFTHGDQLPKGKSIMDVVHQNDFMKDLVQKCGGRCHVIDNKYWNNPRDEYRSNQFQVEELLKTIDKTVLANDGGRYTNEMLQAVEAEIQQEEELIRQSSENMSEEEIRRQARDRAHKKLMIKLAGVTTGALLGALFGVVGMVRAVATVLKSFTVSTNSGRAAAVLAAGTIGVTGGMLAGGSAAAAGTSLGALTLTAAVTASVTGAVKGALTGYDAAEGADSPQEAVKRANEAVQEEAQSFLDKTNDVLESMLQPKSKQSQNLY